MCQPLVTCGAARKLLLSFRNGDYTVCRSAQNSRELCDRSQQERTTNVRAAHGAQLACRDSMGHRLHVEAVVHPPNRQVALWRPFRQPGIITRSLRGYTFHSEVIRRPTVPQGPHVAAPRPSVRPSADTV